MKYHEITSLIAGIFATVAYLSEAMKIFFNTSHAEEFAILNAIFMMALFIVTAIFIWVENQ